MPSDEPSPLLHNVLLFGRVLRALHLRVTSGALAELVVAWRAIDLGQEGDVRAAARCLLVRRREDLPAFEQAFDAFWYSTLEWDRLPPREIIAVDEWNTEVGSDTALPKGKRRTVEVTRERPSLLQPLRSAGDGEEDDDTEPPLFALYSAREILRRKDFASFTDAEVADAQNFLARLRWSLPERKARRQRVMPHGRRPDMRRSFRRSLRHGGELLELARTGTTLHRRRLVLICDISGSMERYTRLLLHFLHSVETNVQRSEVFVFSTRLTRITRELRHRDPDAALDAVATHVEDWAGGTRIGESLATFNRVWARRVLGQGAIVLIISDGWDRGEPSLLAAEMRRLQRSSYRLLWLNPLLGSEHYRPLTQGIQAALPYVDDFLPVHNLQSLEALAGVLGRIQQGRADRGQRPRGESTIACDSF